ncbi:MAG: MFS transporter [Anaerolineae bacterium]|nr:MFS transporter [Anaerolineae bacterium]
MDAQRRNLYILAFIMLVMMLGYGIVVPILPFYIESMGAGGMELGLLTASYAVMLLIFGPIWGSLSDRFGRKPILLVGVLGYVITMTWFGLATQLWMLFVARILAGILSSAAMPTAMAYISDNTLDSERGAGMGLLGAMGGIGTILGPVLGGFLAKTTFSLPFFIAAGMAALALILVALFLPESRPAGERDTEAQAALVDLHIWRQALFSPLGPLFMLTFISTSGLMIFTNIFGLYGLKRFNYSPEEVGIVMMVLGLASALTQGVLVGPITKRWGDVQVVRMGLLFSALGFVVMLLADNFATVLVTTALFAVAYSVTNPALLSLTSQRATVEQGVTMGLSNSFVSLGRIVGPLLGGAVLDIHLSLPYASGAVIIFSGFLASLLWIVPGQVVAEKSEVKI